MGSLSSTEWQQVPDPHKYAYTEALILLYFYKFWDLGFKFLAWSSIARSVCQRAFSLLTIWCLRPWVRILLLAEEDNVSPFDLKIIPCLCQSIEINNNKHVYHQSQVRKPTGSGVKWTECSLILGSGSRVQVFSLILDSSVGLSAGFQSAGDLVFETLGSNPAFSRGTQLVSFRFENHLPVPEHRNWQQQTPLLVGSYHQCRYHQQKWRTLRAVGTNYLVFCECIS